MSPLPLILLLHLRLPTPENSLLWELLITVPLPNLTRHRLSVLKVPHPCSKSILHISIQIEETSTGPEDTMIATEDAMMTETEVLLFDWLCVREFTFYIIT